MSAHPPSDAERQSLRRQARYFMTTRARSRGEVAAFAQRLLELGPTVAIGGLLRDLLLSGNRPFRSDVDFVVDPISMAEFERMVARLGARPNRFGGFGLPLKRWKVDVWPLPRTWAAVNGHVRLEGMHDLLKATFFDWDAVLYSIKDGAIVTGPDYFNKVRDRILDVNLVPNPNPLGNAIRAVRYAYKWDATLGERLAAHVVRQARDHGWEGLVASERRSFSDPVLPMLDGPRLILMLEACLGAGPINLRIAPAQRELPLSGGGSKVYLSPAPAKPGNGGGQHASGECGRVAPRHKCG